MHENETSFKTNRAITFEKLDREKIMNEIITLIHCFSMLHDSKRRVKHALEVLNESTEDQS